MIIEASPNSKNVRRITLNDGGTLEDIAIGGNAELRYSTQSIWSEGGKGVEIISKPLSIWK